MALPKYIRRVVLVIIDAVAVAAAFGLAYFLGGALETITGQRTAYYAVYLEQFLGLVGFLIGVRIALFGILGLYRGIARYAGFHEMLVIVVATGLGTVALLMFNAISPYLFPIPFLPSAPEGYPMRVPWRVVVIEGILTLQAVGGLRFSRRLLLTSGLWGPRTGRNVVIVGVGGSAERVCRELVYNPDSEYRVVALIDPEKAHVGRRLHGVRVVGGVESLSEVIARHNVEEVLIALQETPRPLLQQIVAECEKTRVSFKQLPSLADLIGGKVTVSQLRPFEIEDLLGRPQVELSLAEEQNYLRGECVLITGAGGSIGSELCRQIRRYGPARMVLVGRGENSIYEIASELHFRFDSREIELVIADIRDERRMEHVFAEYRPTVVYHAAAHKHVPLMELHPVEAVTNNIFGTEIVARLADRYGAKVLILISTDKAVRPTNVMGATKRVGEMVVRDIGRASQTRFLTVRFGNVLGSRGSVVPLFKRQIAAGGPVTVTHAEATRYCMTIPEAVSLVIQTGALRDRGSLFLLDMGQPVKMIDLARNLITLSGLEPDVDIPIQIIGLRPGEKLYEELLTQDEGVQRTEVGKVFVTEPENVQAEFLRRHLEALRQAVAASDGARIVATLEELVPDYNPGSNGPGEAT